MKNEKVLSLENKIHGWHTRLKELHFSASIVSIHKIIDDFDSALCEWDDEIMEDSQAIFGFIEPGEISPELPKSLDIENLLIEIRSTLAEFLYNLGDVTMWTGIKSECENFFHQVNKTIYLIKIAKRGD